VTPFSKFGVRPKELIKQGSDPMENGGHRRLTPNYPAIPDRLLGLEAALAFGFGTFIFGDSITARKIAAILLIVSGIALLRIE
jgi:hypothetical protein